MRIEQSNISPNLASVASRPSVTAKTEVSGTAYSPEKNPRDQDLEKVSAVRMMEVNKSETQAVGEEKIEDQERQVIKAIEKANKHIKTYDRRLEFTIHDQTKKIMVKVINTEDESTIREIPSEKILDMVANLWEMAGILVDEKR